MTAADDSLYENLDALAANMRVDDGVLFRVLKALARDEYGNQGYDNRAAARHWLKDQERTHTTHPSDT